MTTATKQNTRRGAKGLATELGLPPYMEARPMKNGGYSYRVLSREKKWISVGWNRAEAMTEYRRILGSTWETDEQDAGAVYRKAKKGAAQRKIEFNISLEEIKEMFLRQGNRCALTQKPFNNSKPHSQRTRPWAASLDRIDSKKGYSRENCRLVCAFVNIALNTYGDGLFTELLEHMVRRIVKDELAKLSLNSHAP